MTLVVKVVISTRKKKKEELEKTHDVARIKLFCPRILKREPCCFVLNLLFIHNKRLFYF